MKDVVIQEFAKGKRMIFVTFTFIKKKEIVLLKQNLPKILNG